MTVSFWVMTALNWALNSPWVPAEQVDMHHRHHDHHQHNHHQHHHHQAIIIIIIIIIIPSSSYYSMNTWWCYEYMMILWIHDDAHPAAQWYDRVARTWSPAPRAWTIGYPAEMMRRGRDVSLHIENIIIIIIIITNDHHRHYYHYYRHHHWWSSSSPYIVTCGS